MADAHTQADVKETCWCNAVKIPEQLLMLLPEESRGKACICLSCIQSFKENPNEFKKHLNK